MNEFERILSLIKKVKKERYPELKRRRFRVIEKEDYDIIFESAMAIVDSEIYFQPRITSYLPSDALEGAIAHELEHAVLGHNCSGLEKYFKDKDYRNRIERETDEGVRKRGFGKQLALFYALEEIWWNKLEVTEEEIEKARDTIFHFNISR